MDFPEQSAQTDQRALELRRVCRLRLLDGLKLISSLLLPVALGIFTVVVTFDQQKSAKLQRIEDQNAAEQLRLQERELNEKRYQDDLFDTYIRDMATLLKDGNGSLISNEVIATVAQVKTLNIFRQLDSTRNNRIIRFLYETKAITEKDGYTPLDLATVELNNTDFRALAIKEQMLNGLSLIGVFLENATFIDLKMENINFARSKFKAAKFSSVQLTNGSFSSVELDNIDFSHSHLVDIDFTMAKLKNVDFSLTTFRNVNFSNASLFNVNFSHAQFVNAKYPMTTIQNVDFSFADLSYSDFLRAKLQNANFSSAILSNDRYSLIS